MNQLWIEQRRGFACEASHEVDAVLVSAQGEVLARLGERCVTTFRSAAKPFQLAACLGLLPEPLRQALLPSDLALGAASHHGEPEHLVRLGELHTRLGLNVGQLYCGAHLPSHEPSAHALLRRGEEPSAMHNNCAGKHSFMALACVARGYAADYRPVEHPLQVHIRAQLDEVTQGGVVGTVLDGCGLPCFVLSLEAMARAWAQLAQAMSQSTGELAAIGQAYRAHPELMSGSLAFDGWLCGLGNVVAKVGAQGLLCVAVPGQSLGIAVKVRSGSDLARPLAAFTALRSWLGDLVPDTLPARHVEVRNVIGDLAGGFIARSPELAPPVH